MREQTDTDEATITESIREIFFNAGFDPDSEILWLKLPEDDKLQRAMRSLRRFDPMEVFNFVQENVSMQQEKDRAKFSRYIGKGNKEDPPLIKNKKHAEEIADGIARDSIIRTMNWYKKQIEID